MFYTNIKDFGARGDGSTDDTEALKLALENATAETGVVYFPPGHYMIKPMTLPSHITLKGESSWGYLNRKSKEGEPCDLDPMCQGRTIISPIEANARAMFDMDGVCGTRIVGLTLDGQDKGENMHGIYSHNIGTEQNICIEDCRIERFSGSGIRLDKVWVFSIRRNLIKSNDKHGIDCSSGYDGWIIDNQLTGNKGAGLFAGKNPEEASEDKWTGMATVMVTANRIEWNRFAGIHLTHSNSMQFTGNSIDHNFGVGIYLYACMSATISGNLLRSSSIDRTDEQSTHIYLEKSLGVSVVGNSFWGWFNRKEHDLTKATPYYNFTLKDNKDCVVSSNAIYEGCGRQSFMDLGGNSNCEYLANPASYPDCAKYGIEG